jgi:predicted CoA-binding protein
VAGTVADVDAILGATSTVLVVDWPSRDVPAALARAGMRVVVRGGPRPDQYAEHEIVDGELVVRPAAQPPIHVDLVYSYRPIDELPTIVTLAQDLGARAVWIQSGLDADGRRDATGCALSAQDEERARRFVESAGLTYIDSPYIVDAVERRP